MYRHKQPPYQTDMLNSLLRVWQGRPERLLDIGGGTGMIGQVASRIFSRSDR